MVTRKNIYHYILYVIFALVFFCTIGLYSISLNANVQSQGSIIGILLRYGIVFVAAAFIILLYKILIPHFPTKYLPAEKPVIYKYLEVAGLFLAVLAMIFIRLMAVASTVGEEINNIYLNFALGVSDKLPNTAMVSYIYALICTLLCKIHPSQYPLYAFNILMHVGVLLFMYFAVKRSLRMRHAIIIALVIAFLPCSFNTITNISPDAFMCFLVSGFVYFLTRINELNINAKFKELYHVLMIAALGLVGGFITSLDIIGTALLVIGITSLILNRNKEADSIIQHRFAQILVFVVSYVLFLFIFLFAINNNGIRNISNVINFGLSFVPRGLNLKFVTPMEGMYDGILILILCAVQILAFIRNENDKGLFFVILVDFASVLTFVKFNSSEYTYIVNICFFVLGVIGLYDIPTFVIPEGEKELSTEEFVHKDKEDNKPKIVSPVPKIPDAYKNSFFNNIETIAVPADKAVVKHENIRDFGPKEELSDEIQFEPLNAEETPVTENIQTDINSTETANIQTDINSTEAANIQTDINSTEAANIQPEINETVSDNVLNEVSEHVSENVKIEENIAVSEENTTVDQEYQTVETITDNIEPEPKVEPVQEEIPVKLDNDNAKRDKILPSRRDYRTAHVYKNKEEESMRARKSETSEGLSLTEAYPEKKNTGMIKNPLPGPKPHIAKELTYDYIPKPDELDFDITDLKGKDYYDI